MLDELKRKLELGSAEEREEAVEELAKLGSWQAIELLRLASRDIDRFVRTAANTALSNLGALDKCSTSEDGEENGEKIRCPICGHLFSDADGGCEHLVISADDSDLIERVITFSNAREAWEELRQGSNCAKSLDFRSFLARFVGACPSASGIDFQSWDGAAPGLSGVWTFIWSDHRHQLSNEIRAAIEKGLVEAKKPKPPEVVVDPKSLQEFVDLALAQGGALGRLIPATGSETPTKDDGEGWETQLEDYPSGDPSEKERRARRRLHQWAERAMRLSGERHPLCLNALEVLKGFSEGSKGYQDLASARSQLFGRTTAAGAVGVPHRCSNAAATLACFHACHPKLDEAVPLTKQYFDLARKFHAESRHQKSQKAPRKQRDRVGGK